MTENQKSPLFHLNDYQIEFVQKFLNPNSQPYQMLITPVGSGKTAISSTIINEIVKSGAKRILVLTAMVVLGEQYKTVLGDFVQGVKVVFLNRKVIREIESLNKQEAYWTNSVVVTTLHMAARGEVRDHILSSAWDLIILDDFADIVFDSYLIDLFRSIAENQTAKRILIFSQLFQNTSNFQDAMYVFESALFKKIEVTKWSLASILAQNKISRNVKLKTIDYKRTKEEIDFIRMYVSLSKLLSNQRLQNKIRSRLVSSSMYAAEKSLRNLRNLLVHGDINGLLTLDEKGYELIKDEELLDDIKTDNLDSKLSKKDLQTLLKECEKVLSFLDQIQVDSKLNSILSLLAKQKLGEVRTWIYASHLTTVTYLYSSISEMFTNPYQISSQTKNNSETINQYIESGGVLIASFASAQLLKGLEFSVDNLIFYDVPKSKELIYLIVTRLLSEKISEGKSKTLNIYLLNDTSDVLHVEKTRLQVFQKLTEQFLGDEM